MNVPKNLMYTKSHEWLKKLDNGNVQVGITDFAQEELGQLVFVNLPVAGDNTNAGEAFADVESVKAVSDVLCPVSGTVAAANEKLLDEPEYINDNPYDAWFVEIEDVTDTETLLTAEEYEAFLAEQH